MKDLLTPFRERYERSRALSVEQQLQECADYLQNPEVLLMEFLEAYYMVEREFDPDTPLKPVLGETDEIVLEPFCEHMEIVIQRPGDEPERITCASGSISPVPGDDAHPELSNRGLDYVGQRAGDPPNIVLGVVERDEEPGETSYLLLLRALNGFAELAAPFQVAKLCRELLGAPLDPRSRFDLQIAIAEGEDATQNSGLLELTRDLAEAFKRCVAESPQFDDIVDRVECLAFDPSAPYIANALSLRWAV